MWIAPHSCLSDFDSNQLHGPHSNADTLNAYCKVAMGKEWSSVHSVYTTKPVRLQLHPSKQSSSKADKSQFYLNSASSKDSPPPSSTVTWETNYLINIHSMEDLLIIRCYDQNSYAPHQFLGEAVLPVGNLIQQSKHLKGFSKGLQLTLPNEELAKKLLANYQIQPCLSIKFDIL